MNQVFANQQAAQNYYDMVGGTLCSAPWQAYNGLWYVTFYERSNW